MQAEVGDKIIIRGKTVGAHDRHGVITEVTGQGEHRRYSVRFDDGHETIVFPGGDFAIEPARGGETTAR